MASATSDPDAYYRVYKALHLITHRAIPCADNSLKGWHVNQQITLPPCSAQCPSGKKPKPPASCPECVAWGLAIESALYQPTTVHAKAKPQLTWSNINQPNLGRSHVEVAKAFVLRLPHKQGGPLYTKMSDFDSASLLMVMARFSMFHNGDPASYDIIMKVAGIRNDLSHMGLKDDMHLVDHTVKQYFQNIADFVTCLEGLHPNHFTSAQDVRDRLKEIQSEPITAKMKKTCTWS
ncbi:uncharacterized protein [Amphiura filiformis]|uniref:uncharacterized protein n=1 Tax=Amphiura filiformis TaxID=82378 RepID=UPI003B228DE8